MSDAERLGLVSLPPCNRQWSEPSGKQMQIAGDLPHGLLSRDHFGWSGYSRLELFTHQKGVNREMESEREDYKESWIDSLLPLYGSLDRNFKVIFWKNCSCVFFNKVIL